MLFLLVGLAVGLEVDRVAEVFWASEHMRNGAGAPHIIVSTIPVIGDVYPAFLDMYGRIHDVPLRDLFGDLRHSVTLNVQMENLTHHLGGFFVHNPM